MHKNCSSNWIEDIRHLNQTDENVINYSKFEIEGTSLLAFRDIPNLIKKYVKGKRTLDYGCGAGRSTRYLKSLNLDVLGVDVSEKFLNACKEEDQIHYCKIQNGQLPFISETYDFVFSSLVFLAIPTRDDIIAALKEIYRVLKKEGVLIIVTGSEKLHSPDMKWVSYSTDFSENQNPKSGSVLRLFIKNANVTFYDYFWSNKDYQEFFGLTGFQLAETHMPIGHKDDGTSWLSEKENPPFVVYVLKKS